MEPPLHILTLVQVFLQIPAMEFGPQHIPAWWMSPELVQIQIEFLLEVWLPIYALQEQLHVGEQQCYVGSNF
jgi:hypothetical protein